MNMEGSKRTAIVVVTAGTVLAAAVFWSCTTFSAVGRPMTAGEVAARAGEIASYMDGRAAAYGLAGAEATIFRGREIIFSRTWGKPGPRQVASTGKTAAAYLAVVLEGRGLLDLDRPLGDYLPEKYFPEGSPGNAITARMVLCHSAGMGADITGKDRTLYYPVGAGFHYSGAGYTYLTRALESISGLPLDDLAERELFGPLGMARSRFSFVRKDGSKSMTAAASLMSTADDYARLLMEILDPTLAPGAMAAEMLRDAAPIGEHYAWGLGVGIQHGADGEALWHTGNNGNYYLAFWIVFRATGVGMVVVAEGRNGEAFYRDLVPHAIGGSYYGFTSTFIDRMRTP